VVFAGLYYAVNKLGVHYGRTDEPAIPEDGVINGGNGVPPSSSYYSSLKSGEGVYVTEGEGVDSFCGMDVNSFMEGEICNREKYYSFAFISCVPHTLFF
jgi:hypothetical protein